MSSVLYDVPGPKARRVSLIASIAGSVLILAGSIPGLPHPLAVLYLIIGVAGLLLFVPGVGRLVWQLAQRRPIVEIGPDGILDRG